MTAGRWERPPSKLQRALFDQLTGDLKPWVFVAVLSVAIAINAWIKGPM